MKKITFLFSALVLLLTSCSATRNSAAMSDDAYQPSGKIEMTDIDKLEEVKEEAKPRKLIYNASITLEVDSTENIKESIKQMTESYDGYMVRSDNSMISVRVPSDQLDNAMSRFKTMGKLISESQSTQDITDNYYDLRTRLESAEKTKERYTQLLARAENVEEVLKVEVELERLNEKIERFKGQLKSLDTQSDYSMITVYFQIESEKVKPGPLGYVFVGLYKGIKWLFVRG